MKVEICGIATVNSLCCWSFKNLNDIIHTNHLCCWSYKNLNAFILYWNISYGFIIATRNSSRKSGLGKLLLKSNLVTVTMYCTYWKCNKSYRIYCSNLPFSNMDNRIGLTPPPLICFCLLLGYPLPPHPVQTSYAYRPLQGRPSSVVVYHLFITKKMLVSRCLVSRVVVEDERPDINISICGTHARAPRTRALSENSDNGVKGQTQPPPRHLRPFLYFLALCYLRRCQG